MVLGINFRRQCFLCEGMPMEVSISELRAKLPFYVERAQAGEQIEITQHGVVVAKLMQPTDRRERAKQFMMNLRSAVVIGDIVSPTDESWVGDNDHL
jgi:prevent-host-death family protein